MLKVTQLAQFEARICLIQNPWLLDPSLFFWGENDLSCDFINIFLIETEVQTHLSLTDFSSFLWFHLGQHPGSKLKKNRSVATYYHCKSFTNICAVVWTEIPLSCCPWACLLHMLLSEGFLLMSGEMRGAEIICGCLVGTSNLALNGLHMDLWSWEKS